MYKENSFYNYSRKRYSTISLSIRWLQKSFKKVVENSQIYLDCIAKPRTFAPAFQERDSLTIDILLKFKALENKNKKTSEKVWKLSEKVPIFITLLEYQDVRKLVIKYRAKFLIQTTTKIYFLPLFIDNFRKEFTRIILIS